MRTLVGACLLLVITLASCSSTGRARPEAPVEQTTVEVRNQNYLDLNVHVVSGGHRVRLGTVTGSSTRTFVIPSRMVFGTAVLRFEMDPIGSSARPRPQEMSVSTGQHIILSVPSY